jgi:DNA-binding XRE family transcriptional regulator
MAQPRGTAPLENRIHPWCQAAGLSQQELARRCRCARQTINAIEVGHYVSSTLVALCIARVLASRMEDLFCLTQEHPQIEAEWLGASAAGGGRMRVQLARVGDRLFARPLTGAQALLTAADGLARPLQARCTRRSSSRRLTVDLLINAEILDHTVAVLRCDPALALLATHVSRRYPGFRLCWIHSSSLAALRMFGRGEAHAAGTHL